MREETISHELRIPVIRILAAVAFREVRADRVRSIIELSAEAPPEVQG